MLSKVEKRSISYNISFSSKNCYCTHCKGLKVLAKLKLGESTVLLRAVWLIYSFHKYFLNSLSCVAKVKVKLKYTKLQQLP